MAQQEPAQTEEAEVALLERLRTEAPWLFEPELGTCIVGSQALREACRRAGIEGPISNDLDLAWAVTLEQGDAILAEHDVAIRTTTANRGRGTLAFWLGDERVEITTFRGAGLDEDLARRDMTFGALAWRLADDRIVDPLGGLDDWREGVVRAVGDPADRVREHPIRWLRYFRKAHAFGFALDNRIRKLDLDPSVLDEAPAEAIAAEFRAALESLESPGRLMVELFECRVLQHVAPELAPQFDGRPAGPVRYHPEIGQALHVVLALEWAVANTRSLDPLDAYAVRFAVLCHDLGKNLTPTDEFPSHRGHEAAGRQLVERFCKRMPGIADQPTRKLALEVCELHLLARGLRELRPGTLAKLYDEHFRGELRRDLFAIAVAADSAGRLGHETEGTAVADRVAADIAWICERCEAVDAQTLREEHAEIADFRRALHEARARNLTRG